MNLCKTCKHLSMAGAYRDIKICKVGLRDRLKVVQERHTVLGHSADGNGDRLEQESSVNRCAF